MPLIVILRATTLIAVKYVTKTIKAIKRGLYEEIKKKNITQTSDKLFFTKGGEASGESACLSD